MKIMIAPDSLKGSLRATAAAKAIATGCLEAGATVDACPLSDGGEGFVEALVAAVGGTIRQTQVNGPLCEPVEAAWATLPDGSAVIEMAAASGLELVPEARRDPTRTTTFGTGQLIKAALDAGCERLIIGIGGSATCDGGAGMAQALGAVFIDRNQSVISRPLAGGDLSSISKIRLDKLDTRLADTPITIACDVTNPLIGPNGAAAVYGPQKGATLEQVAALDSGLAHLASLLLDVTGRDVAPLEGAGAAGGLGAGLMGFLGAKMRSGIATVLEAVEFDKRVRECDVCITAEGRLDGQSLSGKAVMGVAHAASKFDVPTYALVGSAAEDADAAIAGGLAGYRVIGEGLSIQESIARTEELLTKAASKLVADLSR